MFRQGSVDRESAVTIETSHHHDHDVLVVGGGPVGLATAIAVRRNGLDVVLAERRNLPFTNACGEGILPDGVDCLRRLGVHLPEDASQELRGISFHESGRTLQASFTGRTGIGITRSHLHAALRQRAEELGVDLRWGVSLREILPGGARLTTGRLQARWIIAADGNNSPVRSRLGLDGRIRHARVGLRRHYRTQPWSDGVQVWFSSGCEIYVTPTAADMVSVTLLTDHPRWGFDHHMNLFPELSQRLHGRTQASRQCGALTFFRRARRVTRGRVALVGDASLSLDAITGAGMALGFRQAEAVAEAIARDDLRLYARAHARLARIPILMTRLLLAVHRYPQFRRGLMALLQRSPAILDSLLAIHTRAAVREARH
jgi:flavin-dependent dehydrogenase